MLDEFDGSHTVVLDRRFFDGAKGVIGIRNGIIAGFVVWALLIAALVVSS